MTGRLNCQVLKYRTADPLQQNRKSQAASDEKR